MEKCVRTCLFAVAAAALLLTLGALTSSLADSNAAIPASDHHDIPAISTDEAPVLEQKVFPGSAARADLPPASLEIRPAAKAGATSRVVVARSRADLLRAPKQSPPASSVP